MVDVDLRGAVIGGIAVRAQHVVGPLVGGLADVPAAGARAGDPHRVGQAAFADLVGEHLLGHRRPADVARADEGDVQPGNQTPKHLRRLGDRRDVRARHSPAASAKSALP